MQYHKNYIPESGICYHSGDTEWFVYQINSMYALGMITSDQKTTALNNKQHTLVIRGVINEYKEV